MKELFNCGRCGYEAQKLAGLRSCPLCVKCQSCSKTLRRCRCLEGE